MASLSSDSGFVATDVFLHEMAPGLCLVGKPEHVGSTRVRGRSIPSGGEVRKLSFEGLTANEGLFASSSLIRLLRDFYAGSPIRVYRDVGVVTPWSTTNLTGYSDIVVDSVQGTSFPWYGTVMTRGEFTLEGMEF